MWRYEKGETPEKKPRKMPYYANGKRRVDVQGSPSDREKLATYVQTSEAARRGGFDGVGFAFLPGDGLIGIDLDGMIDTETGDISERCAGIIQACASYTEYSPSGKGVHIICTDLPGRETRTFKSNKEGVEVFTGRQYFTFTGRRWPGSPAEVAPLADKTLKRLQATVRGGKATPAQAAPQAAAPAPVGGRQRSLAETVALAEEALGHVDPDEYLQWIEIGMACKAGLSSAGYYVWDAWSARSPKYAGGEDTRKRWDGFKPTELTLGTVFGLAEASGWVSPWAKAKGRTRKPAPPTAPPSAPVSEEARQEAHSSAAENHSCPSKAPAGGNDSFPPEPPDDDDWERGLISKKGDLSPCLANAELILSHMPAWQGVIAYDEFSERTVFRAPLPFDPKGEASGEWSDHLDVKATIWLQRAWRVEFSTVTVGKAIESMARDHRFHPVREALAALPPWDGTRRNSEWLSDYLGVKRTEYTALVGTFFLRGMVQRVMRPGSKFDYAMVLEGEQGRGKSTVARLLAWHWFCDTDLDLSNKDSLLALPGHWVYEIAELGSLMKAEERKQKSFLSRQEDEFRPPYGQRLIKVPRQNVFIGTTNEEEYLKDATGGRRFWPVMCGDSFNLDGLRDAFPQMYAEALADFEAGERAYPSPEEQTRLFTPEQARRGMEEPFEDILRTWVKGQVAAFSMADAAIEGLHFTADKLTPAVVTRIGIALKKLGCGREEHRLAADPGQRRLYLPPKLARAGVPGTNNADDGASHAYF